MAWPTTKAGTTNVDAGSDSPTNARADIKQNIDNVNSIIDEFNISSPSDGDLLQYSSSSGQWEQVASSTLASSAPVMILPIGSRTFYADDSARNLDIARLYESNLITNAATEDRWTHNSTGNYLLECYITGSLDHEQSATRPGCNISVLGGSLVYDERMLSVPSYNLFQYTSVASNYFLLSYTVTSTTQEYSLNITPNSGSGSNSNKLTLEDYNNWVKIYKV